MLAALLLLTTTATITHGTLPEAVTHADLELVAHGARTQAWGSALIVAGVPSAVVGGIVLGVAASSDGEQSLAPGIATAAVGVVLAVVGALLYSSGGDRVGRAIRGGDDDPEDEDD